MVQFASYLRRVLCKTRLIFPRINGPNVYLRLEQLVHVRIKYTTVRRSSQQTALKRVQRLQTIIY